MIATVITVGEELLMGQIADTNAAWLCSRLYSEGVRVRKVVSVGDRSKAITEAVALEWHRADLLIITGGLGSTPDDMTRQAIARFFKRKLVRNTEALDDLKVRFPNLYKSMPAAAARLAMVPEGFEPVFNPAGTAAGLFYEDDNGRTLFAVPGVPREMEAIYEKTIERHIAEKGTATPTTYRVLCTAGVPEPRLASKLSDLFDKHRIGFLPAPGRVRLRLAATGDDAEQKLDVLEVLIRTRIGDCIFGKGEDKLEAVLGRILRSRRRTIAVAESCTGGRLLDRLTNVAGASKYVRGGIIAYSNRVKSDILGVDKRLIAEHGAVSKHVAVAMARGVRTTMGADIGISITGVAGPGGGTPKKPVGTVWIGYDDQLGSETYLHQLHAEREFNIEKSVILALDMARRKELAKSHTKSRTS